MCTNCGCGTDQASIDGVTHACRAYGHSSGQGEPHEPAHHRLHDHDDHRDHQHAGDGWHEHVLADGTARQHPHAPGVSASWRSGRTSWPRTTASRHETASCSRCAASLRSISRAGIESATASQQDDMQALRRRAAVLQARL